MNSNAFECCTVHSRLPTQFNNFKSENTPVYVIIDLSEDALKTYSHLLRLLFFFLFKLAMRLMAQIRYCGFRTTVYFQISRTLCFFRRVLESSLQIPPLPSEFANFYSHPHTLGVILKRMCMRVYSYIMHFE